MSLTLIGAIVAILTAAIIYTVAVFAERRSHLLRPWHLALFWAGLVFDTVGTTLMGNLTGGFELNLHGILGVVAIALMLLHAGWATAILVLKKEQLLRDFHRFSFRVWVLWMISLVTGMALAIPAMFG